MVGSRHRRGCAAYDHADHYRNRPVRRSANIMSGLVAEGPRDRDAEASIQEAFMPIPDRARTSCFLRENNSDMKPKISSMANTAPRGCRSGPGWRARDDLDMLSIPEAERRNASLRAERLAEADIASCACPTKARANRSTCWAANNSTRVIDTSTANPREPGLGLWLCRDGCGPGRGDRQGTFRRHPGCYPQAASGSSARWSRPASCRPTIRSPSMPLSGYSGGGKQMIAQMEQADHPEHIASPHFLYGLSLTAQAPGPK